MDEAKAILQKKIQADADIEPHLTLLATLMNCGDDEGVSTDDFVVEIGRDSQQVIKMLKELDQFKLLSDETEMA